MSSEIVAWWEDHFPYYVAFPMTDGRWITEAMGKCDWLENQYPDMSIDKTISRVGEGFEIKPYYSYDAGFTHDSFANMIVFYFKDATIAMHFKLAWV